jgi:phosphoglycerate dehydrogenase-like enzyme
MTGTHVAKLLQAFDVKVLACTSQKNKAIELGVEQCLLEDIFIRSDVVSLHTPWLRETEGMVKGEHFASMKQNATFINTARGAVVREEEMIDVLRRRPDLFAVLDVTCLEPPSPQSPLFSLPNVVLTPHIAGSMDAECRRMGRYMVNELKRYVTGEPLRWLITREKASSLA